MNDGVTPKRWLVLAAFSSIYLIWGSTYLAIRFAVETLPPFFMAGVRFLVAGVAMSMWVRWRNPERPTFLQWRSAVIIGGLLLLGGNGGVVWAAQHVASSVTVLLIAMVPMWMVLLNWVRRDGVKPGILEVGGITLGLVGVFLLVSGGDGSGGEPVHRIGAIVLALASLSWAAGSIYSQHAPLPKSPLLATSMQMLAGAGWLLLAGVLSGEGSRVDPAGFSVLSILSLGYLIVFGALIGFTAYVWLLQVSTPAKVSTYAFVNPAIAVGLGCTLGGEPFTRQMLAATTVIIGGVVLVTLHRAKATQPCKPVTVVKERTEDSPALPCSSDARVAPVSLATPVRATDETRCR